MKNARPWGDYVLRILACLLLAVTGFILVAKSTFALRLRDDVPGGAQTVALALTAVLSLLPLAFRKRFLGAFLVSAFLLTGIGAYWWTTIPWDELVTESDFTAGTPPRTLDYALTLAPVFIAAFYAAVSRASILRADYLRRGADPDEARHAAAASFLAGAVALVLSTVMTAILVAALASGAVQGLPGLVGVPALIVAALLVVLAYVFGSGSFLVGGKAARGGPAPAGAQDAEGGTPPPAAKKRKALG